VGISWVDFETFIRDPALAMIAMADRKSETVGVEVDVDNRDQARQLYHAVGGVKMGGMVGEHTVSRIDVCLEKSRIIIDVYVDINGSMHQTAGMKELTRSVAPSKFQLEAIHTTTEELGNRLKFTVTLE